MVICQERGADLHMEVQIGFTFLVLAHPGSPGKTKLNVCVCYSLFFHMILV